MDAEQLLIKKMLEMDDCESVELQNALKLSRLFPLDKPIVTTDCRLVQGGQLVSSGRIPKELWLRYILKYCEPLALFKLERCSRFFHFHINYVSCKECDYSKFNPDTMTRDELEIRFIRSVYCTSLWTR